MRTMEPFEPQVHELVGAFQREQLTRRQFLERGAQLLGSLAAANSLLAACTLPAAGSSGVTPAVAAATTSPAGAAGPVNRSSTSAAPTAAALGTTPLATAEPTAGSAAPTLAPVQSGGGQTVDYQGPGEGYLVMPAGSGPFPAVVVIQEWWGLDAHIKSVADRFAQAGFIALAPDLYHGHIATEPDEARKLAMALEQDVAIEEIQNAVTFLARREDVSPAQVAIIGFCMGGALALQMAVQGERVAVVAPFYGRPLEAAQADKVKVPVVGSYGSQDTGISAADVKAMVERINAAGQPVDVKFYPAGHAFFNDTRPSYNAAAAADAWQRTLAAFRSYLGV